MTDTRTAIVVSFRDAAEPRALAARLVATATRHAYGWSLHLPGVGTTEHVTFDAAALTVARTTGVRKMLIVWSTGEAAHDCGRTCLSGRHACPAAPS
jgi:hypothetical protein